MDEHDWLAQRFQEHRPHLRAVAYRMLGSLSEAEDAVQEAWLRVSRSDAGGIENLGGWLTTIVARVSLNMLRSRRSRHEDPVGVHVPEPIVSSADGVDPEQQALLADSVGLALLVVLETLDPAERLAFVLHDTFGVPFGEIAPMVDRSPGAARQLASRARRRIRAAGAAGLSPDADPVRQREVVDAFFSAARGGDFDALVEILDPDVVVRSDTGARPARPPIRGARVVARGILSSWRLDRHTRPALVNGAAGVIAFEHGRPVAVAGFTVRDGRIAAIDVLADPDRLRRLDLSLARGSAGRCGADNPPPGAAAARGR